MIYKIERLDDRAVVFVDEEFIDFETSEDFKVILKGLEKEGFKTIELDLSKVIMIQSIAIGMLLLFRQQYTHNGGVFKVKDISPELKGIFGLVGIDKMFIF